MSHALENFIIYSLVAVVSVIVTRMVSRRSEKLKETMELFRYYHSPQMFKARSTAWRFLNNDYPENPVAFHELFVDKFENSELYEDLSKILYFWVSLYALKKEKAIHKKLARELFLTQYIDWESAIKPLYEKSKKSEYRPDWFVFYEDDNMGWLKSGG